MKHFDFHKMYKFCHFHKLVEILKAGLNNCQGHVQAFTAKLLEAN